MRERNKSIKDAVECLNQQLHDFLESNPIGSLETEDFNEDSKKALIEIRRTIKRVDKVTGSYLSYIRTYLTRNEPVGYTVRPDAPGSNKEELGGYTRLREFSRGAEELIIVDPYFFGGEAIGASHYISKIVRASRLKRGHMHRVHVFYDESKAKTKKIMTDFKKACSDHSINLSVKSTEVFHDRFWIKDRKSALIIGTSLGGLGNKFCYITPMEKGDISMTLEYIREQKLL